MDCRRPLPHLLLALVVSLSLGVAASTGCAPGDDAMTTVTEFDSDSSDSASPDGDTGSLDAAADANGASPDTGPSDTAADGDTSSDTDQPDTAEPTDDAGGANQPDAGSGDSPEECGVRERFCNGACTNVLSNPHHCGGCGNACSGSGARCVQGICQCPDSFNKCNGKCVDPTSNDNHCFECGNACGAGMTCQKSVCIEENRKQAVVKYMNQTRQTSTDCGKYGTEPAGPKLTVNKELEEAAQAYAEKMAEHGFFAHEDPLDGSNFVERVNRTNYSGRALGENLSRGLRQTAKVVAEGWRKSDDHCRVLANPSATEVGIGLAEPTSGQFDAYWVMLTGTQ